MGLNAFETQLINYTVESNDIEGIEGYREIEIAALTAFLEVPRLMPPDMLNLASVYTRGIGMLRLAPGMDVRVGNHLPPRGGPHVIQMLDDVLDRACSNTTRHDAFQTYIDYETLHPFMDGNGRTGRALFLWQELKGGRTDVLVRGFLREWHYRTLECARVIPQ